MQVLPKQDLEEQDTVDWVTTPESGTGDSPITAVTGSGYFLNTTAGVNNN